MNSYWKLSAGSLRICGSVTESKSKYAGTTSPTNSPRETSESAEAEKDFL